MNRHREMGRCNGHGKVLVKVARLFMVALHALSRGARGAGYSGSAPLRHASLVHACKRPRRARPNTDLSLSRSHPLTPFSHLSARLTFLRILFLPPSLSLSLSPIHPRAIAGYKRKSGKRRGKIMWCVYICVLYIHIRVCMRVHVRTPNRGGRLIKGKTLERRGCYAREKRGIAVRMAFATNRL